MEGRILEIVKNRAPGEGSIFQRGDGHWVGSYQVETAEGNKKRKYLSGKSRKEVSGKLRDALQEQRDNGGMETSSLRVEDYLDRWLEADKEDVRGSTYKSYTQIIEKHLKPSIGSVGLSKLTAMHLQKMYSKKLAEGLSPNTVRLIHAVISKALSKAVLWRYIAFNAAKVATPSSAKYSTLYIQPLTAEQIRHLLEVSHDDRFYAYALMATAGLRTGECLGLQWPDIDLDKGTLQVWRSVRYGKVS